MLHLARNLNRRWDQQYAQSRLADLGIPLGRKVGKLSGGQQAQLALTIALARRPDLLVLDEPLAMLDPVARDDFMASVLSAVAADGVSVVLSSHVLAELERMADYLIVLSRGQVQVAGEVEDLLARHRMLTAPAAEVGDPAGRMHVVQRRLAGQQLQLLIRTATPARRRPLAGSPAVSPSRNSCWPTCASPVPRPCPAWPKCRLEQERKCRHEHANHQAARLSDARPRPGPSSRGHIPPPGRTHPRREHPHRPHGGGQCRGRDWPG